MRLNGWQRIGVVISVLWAVAAFVVVRKTQVNSAGRSYYFLMQVCLDGPSSGQQQCMEKAQRIYQACCYAVLCATEVVDFAYFWAGSQALRRPHPLGRIQRDMRMAENIHLYVDTTVMTSTVPSLMQSYRSPQIGTTR